MEAQISLEDQQHKARRRVNIGGTIFKDSLFDENIRITFYIYWLYTSPARVRPSTPGHRCPQGDVIKWKHFPCYWSFVRGIHRSPVNSTHKGQWRGALVFSFICTCINGLVNNREAGDLRRHRAHYTVTVMQTICLSHADILICIKSYP